MSPAHHRQRTPAEQQAHEREDENAREEMKRMEEGDSVPSDPTQWPTGKAKFLTFGNDGDHAYGDGPTAMLGPAGVELHSDGPPTIRGEKAKPKTVTPPRRVRFSFRRRAR